MQTYETLFIASPTLAEDEERATIDALSEIVTGGGGTLVANERMGRRRLAYPIEKHIDGVYFRFLYDSGPAVPKELERRIRLSDRVLRALTVRLEPKWAAAAKEQALVDARARAEAAERERLEREAAATGETDDPSGEAGGDATSPSTSGASPDEPAAAATPGDREEES